MMYLKAEEIEARHDAIGGFYDDDDNADVCVHCRHLATVYDVEYFCDKHWLYCNDCGTGLVKGIDYVACPKCMADFFKETANG